MILAKTLGIKTRLGILISLNLIMSTWPSCGSIPHQYRSFLELSEEKQRIEIRSSPVDRQVELYLVAMRYIHPPPIGLADEIAKGAEPILPALLKALKSEKDGDNQQNIIYVLEVMHSCCHNLQNEKEVTDYLQEISNSTKDENLKARSDEALRFIIQGELPDTIKLLNRTWDEPRKH